MLSCVLILDQKGRYRRGSKVVEVMTTGLAKEKFIACIDLPGYTSKKSALAGIGMTFHVAPCDRSPATDREATIGTNREGLEDDCRVSRGVILLLWNDSHLFWLERDGAVETFCS